MCRTEPITAKMMDTCTNLKVIGKQGAGLDNIDMDHAHAKDITVVYAPAGNANAVAEHAVMLMLMCAKRFTYVDRQFRGGNFLVRMGMEHTYELGGKTLGMIGCGRISQLAMQKCKYGFGMKVIGYDPYLTQDKIGDLCELKATAKEVWEQADFVSVHLPVVPSTEHSIGREQFSWMKPTASFINCARGALIKEDELVACLQDGTLFQAGLDVFEHEPIQESIYDQIRFRVPSVQRHGGAQGQEPDRQRSHHIQVFSESDAAMIPGPAAARSTSSSPPALTTPPRRPPATSRAARRRSS